MGRVKARSTDSRDNFGLEHTPPDETGELPPETQTDVARRNGLEAVRSLHRGSVDLAMQRLVPQT